MIFIFLFFYFSCYSFSVDAAISLDRTRIIFDGSRNSLSLTISNENNTLPFLAQGWLENPHGETVNEALVVLPPIQRIEPSSKSQVKIQSISAANNLSQDRETLFYFNLREIPPRSDNKNTLQLALQTKVKLFYRPASIINKSYTEWQKEMTMENINHVWHFHNPTPFHLTLVDFSGQEKNGFLPIMIEPKSVKTIELPSININSKPELTYINDFGGRKRLVFNCQKNNCSVSSIQDAV